MQTYILHPPPWEKTAKLLPNQILCRQCNWALQLFKKLTQKKKDNWDHYPLVLQWTGYEAALRKYGIIMTKEASARGYLFSHVQQAFEDTMVGPVKNPPWVKDKNILNKLIWSHRKSLRYKYPVECKDLAESGSPLIFWPVRHAPAPFKITSPVNLEVIQENLLDSADILESLDMVDVGIPLAFDILQEQAQRIRNLICQTT